ncbi:hypothetical protein E4198_06500 [Streptomyces sp. RKND-216]|uniref:hypothetical protein n=1 Tax=Streptomyces sp. RKND-216 TaxID=2562581 RepID=UPI00109DD094|nr:hypothetical protein [Streptomyces sp. RKND-216]THA24441.1 hypothetical protein E4198_06500 [Streptomyces sp. RKND-216]
MLRTLRTAGPACLLTVTLLSGCGPDEPSASDRSSRPAGPTATTTAAPEAAARLAGRFHEAGGPADVYGIEVTDGPGDAPLVVVRTHGTDDAATFEELKTSLTGFLAREEGVPLQEGYLLDVYGPDGSLRHRLDARP